MMHSNALRARSSQSSLAADARCVRVTLMAAALLSACVPRERPKDDSASKAAAAVEIEEVNDAQVTESPEAKPAPASASAAVTASRSGAVTAEADPLLTAPFSDDFERASLGDAWRATSSAWTLSEGQLCGENARNHPIWLARRLPANAVIAFSAMTSSEDGDIKAEYWGDGSSSASGQSYTDATSYLTIFGGWKNRFHVLARLDEHAPDRKEIKLSPGAADFIGKTVVPHQTYKFQVERRDGRKLRWFVDDMEISTYADPEPLRGQGHEHFGFNDWQVKVCFDNLRVTPLGD